MLPMFHLPRQQPPQQAQAMNVPEAKVSPQSQEAAELGMAAGPSPPQAAQQAERSNRLTACLPSLLPMVAVQKQPEAALHSKSRATPCRSSHNRRRCSESESGATPVAEVRIWIEATPTHQEPGCPPPPQPDLQRNKSCGV
mmetsp:Transcript_75884/g.180316  ORF Transcript_75884/g.180316 Transcript_75884/m.180316 type:complete len:141 (-) Transcript_75884:110-532(-)|eukprot:CAMPEP_0178452142 /NCGR_PEP_ID=MMETSP0689_2-20121128/44076_1 /TAXON_ID=160604 /ORGANISM="Amphidinium massartii, Strain CS-259" /LENGTH=140 /DNA_ID=CAMNT_0020077807 /DNA_START=126 /DNA_END=548 /DNA_ORIENTATION=+